jgi:hypothetical protein
MISFHAHTSRPRESPVAETDGPHVVVVVSIHCSRRCSLGSDAVAWLLKSSGNPGTLCFCHNFPGAMQAAEGTPPKVRKTTHVGMRETEFLIQVPVDMFGTLEESGEHCFVKTFPCTNTVDGVSKLMHNMGAKERVEFCFSLVRTWPRLLAAVREYDEGEVARTLKNQRHRDRIRKKTKDAKLNKTGAILKDTTLKNT